MQDIDCGTALGNIVKQLLNDFLVRKLLGRQKRKSLKPVETLKVNMTVYVCINQVDKEENQIRRIQKPRLHGDILFYDTVDINI